MKSPAELTVLFRAGGRKVTPQRQAIFGILHGAESHPTAEAVFAAASAVMPTISLRTVYQTLNDLAEMGEIAALDLGTGSARFDPNIDSHHHLVCVVCGNVADVYADASVVALAERDTSGFEVATTEVIFRGRCADCRGSQPDHNPPPRKDHDA